MGIELQTVRAGMAILLMAAVLPWAAAQDGANKPMKLVVPFAPGGVADTLGRGLAERLATRLGQPVVVENRAGASGNLGTEFVAKSAPDGSTLLIAFDGTMVINPHVYAKLASTRYAISRRSPSLAIRRRSWSRTRRWRPTRWPN